jgi:arabinogalactan endo-1,4-beta-galactosidase
MPHSIRFSRALIATTALVVGVASPLSLRGANDAPASATQTSPKIVIPQGYILGADLSSIPASEDRGAVYMDKGKKMDILQIFKAHGFNYVRVRIFVDPTAPGGYSPQGYCGLEQTIKFGQRIKAAGMGFLLDFHYSDTWADPGKQTKPAAWRDMDLPTLAKTVHDYTKDVITKLKAAGAEPDMVQTGNEITPGMLLNAMPGNRGGGSQVSTQPEGSTKNWDNLATLLKAAIAGVKEVDPKILVMLHIDRGHDNKTSVTWVDNALAHGVQFDIFGESCYTTWQGPPTVLQANFEDLVKRYPNLYFINDEYGGSIRDANGDIYKSATAATPSEANPHLPGIPPGLDWTMRAENDVMFNLPDGKGLGTFIWEPTQNGNEQALFSRDPATGANVANQQMYLFDAMAKAYASRGTETLRH